MSTALSSVNDNLREVCIQARFVPGNVMRGATRRLGREDGQTAAEYMGILLLVGAIIAALMGPADLPGKISSAASNAVTSIGGGAPAEKGPAKKAPAKKEQR